VLDDAMGNLMRAGRMMAAFFAVFLMAAAILATPARAQQSEEEKPQSVIVAPVRIAEVVDRIEALGTTRANETVRVTATVTGKIREINFDDGQEVAAGDVLVVLETAEEEAQLKAAEAVLAERRLAFDRSRQLERQQFATTAQLEERRAAVQESEAQIEEIKARIADRVIRAPFGGLVGLRNISLGALVAPGDLITTLDDLSLIKLDFSVPATYLRVLRPGLQVIAKTDALADEPFSGELRSVDTQVDPVSRSVVARALLPNPERMLRPGLLMTVELLKNPRQALVIPEAALIPRGRNNAVLVVDGGKAVRREVEIGTRRPGEVEIVSGLSEGEHVITHGTLTVRPGQSVTIMTVQEQGEPLRKVLTRAGTRAEGS
jgi:membrane fusion protein (multidrug efflux system)